MLNCELVVDSGLIDGKSHNIDCFELLKSFMDLDLVHFLFAWILFVVQSMVDIVLDRVVATLVNVYLLLQVLPVWKDLSVAVIVSKIPFLFHINFFCRIQGAIFLTLYDFGQFKIKSPNSKTKDLSLYPSRYSNGQVCYP